MAISLLLAGLAAAVFGAGAHMTAKETNEKAQKVIEQAKEEYEQAKNILEKAQKDTEKALLVLGYSKKNVLETSFEQFCRAYERVKHIQVSESIGISEISKLIIDEKEVVQLREMSNIYQSVFSSSVAGAATGTVVALAASGALPAVTGALSTAGAALFTGHIGAAATMAGSALSAATAITPLAAIAAPALLFSGISANIKADENLEKAKTMYAEVEVAIEKMDTSEVLCKAIEKKAYMFNDLLFELYPMFSKCTALLDSVTSKKKGVFKKKQITAEDLTKEELNLIAVTRALAGAVKAVIDTPILNEEGEISVESNETYENTKALMPALVEKATEVQSVDFGAKVVAQTQSSVCSRMVGIIITLFLGWLGIHRFMTKKYLTGIVWFLTSGLFFVGWIVDFIVVCTGNFKNKDGNYWTN